jgi:hypothetical protein
MAKRRLKRALDHFYRIGSVTSNFYEDTKDSLGIVINESFRMAPAPR